jgi:hypothetical protein
VPKSSTGVLATGLLLCAALGAAGCSAGPAGTAQGTAAATVTPSDAAAQPGPTADLTAATAPPGPTADLTAATTPPGTRFWGPAQPIGAGTARAYVITDESGNPVEVGVRMTRGTLSGLPTQDTPPPAPAILQFPGQASAGVFDHVAVYWNPHGHEPPGVFDKPHFDFHFYMVDPAAVAAIDPTRADFPTRAAHLPDARYMPTDFVTPPGSLITNTVPGMGLHWLDPTAGLIPGVYDFKQVMINGSYDGTYTFLEPMITLDWLAGHNSTAEALKQPQAYQRTGLYPTLYAVRQDSDDDGFDVALGRMLQRQAS